MSNEKLVLVPELMGTAAAHAKDSTIVEIKNDIGGFVEKNLGIKFSATALSTVENTAGEVNLCLPYYAHLAAEEGTGIVDDAAMAGVVGGLTTEESTANWHQSWNNARLVFMGHFSKVDNDYDGTFDVETESTGFAK